MKKFHSCLGSIVETNDSTVYDSTVYDSIVFDLIYYHQKYGQCFVGERKLRRRVFENNLFHRNRIRKLFAIQKLMSKHESKPSRFFIWDFTIEVF